MDSVRIAIFSDIHGNLEALEAVLADMEKQNVQEKVCLGDIVGYGPDPAKCLELVREIGCPIVQGNHDQGSVESNEDPSFNTYAKAGLEHTRKQLNEEQKEFLVRLPMKIEGDGSTFVHASLYDKEPWFYICDKGDVACHFEYQTQPVCFCGHTHKPVVWRQTKGKAQELPFTPPFTLDPDSKYLINVGSVGQSRTLNPDASYVIFDTIARMIEYRLVPYDFKKTQKKIIRAGLPRYLAQRLALGR
jgi:predicted phosphodiesterase